MIGLNQSDTRFIAINIKVKTKNNYITNNIISSIKLTSRGDIPSPYGSMCCINIISGNVIVSGNTFGSTSGKNSLVCISSYDKITFVGIYCTSNHAIEIRDNTFGGFTSNSPSMSNGENLYVISINNTANSLKITNNIIGNSSINNMLAGDSLNISNEASVAIAINVVAACVVTDISKNTIQNFITFGYGNGYLRGISTGTSSNISYSYKIDSNIIRNLRTYSRLIGSYAGNTAATGIQYCPGLNGSVSYNNISNISCAYSPDNIIAAGITLANAKNVIVNGNKISLIKNAGENNLGLASAAIACGILITTGRGTYWITNNMIALGAGETTNTLFVGIYAMHTSTLCPTDKIYNNTVTIEGTVGYQFAILPSFALHRGNLWGTIVNNNVDIRNNIFKNTRSGGAGKHYAIANFYNRTLISGFGINISNYNILNGDSLTIGYWDGDRTFASWKSASSCDSNSFTNIPLNFINSNDLHLNFGTTPTLIESGGTPIKGLNSDFDLQARPGISNSTQGGGYAPDIGCDEFDGKPIDIYKPIISYPYICNTNSTSNYQLINFAMISDFFSGIDTIAGTKPRLYYKKSTDNNTITGNTAAFNGWKYVEPTNNISPFNFTINYSILFGGSVTLGDKIEYFVVAQDRESKVNIACNPSEGFSGTSVFNIINVPQFPNSFVIVNTLSNTNFSVGTGQQYTSLTGNNGIFNAINNGLLSGNSTITIFSDLSEDGTNPLNPSGLCGYLLTIQPSSASLKTINNNANLNQAMIRINGASGVAIDGRYNGSGQFLRFINTNSVSGNGKPAIGYSGSTKNVIIRNCLIESNTSALDQATIYLGSGDNVLTLLANEIRDAQGSPGTTGIPYSAIYSNQKSNKIIVGSATVNDGNKIYNFSNYGLNFLHTTDSLFIRNNSFYQTASRSSTFIPINILNGNFHNISNNNIFQTSGINTGGFAGIYLGGLGVGHTINNNSIGGSNISRTGAAFTFNSPNAPSPFYVSGIYVVAGDTPFCEIQGNYFSNIGNIAIGSTALGAGVFAINIESGNVNIGNTSGNIIGGLNLPSDTVISGYDNGMINYIGEGSIQISNNHIGNISNYNVASNRNSGINISSECQAKISNNLIHDINGKSSDVALGNMKCPIGICIGGNLVYGSIIESNTIYNISNSNNGAGSYQSLGLLVFSSDKNLNIKRNRIYNIKTSGTGKGSFAAPKAIGVYLGSLASTVFANNQITIGNGAINESQVYGIYDNGTLSNNYYYNSIYLLGVMDSSANGSFCFYKNSGDTVTIFNNIFYNDRTTSGNGRMFAAAYAGSLLNKSISNNLMVTSSSKNVILFNSTIYDFKSWKSFSSKDLSSLADTTFNLAANNLFSSISNGNLNINPSNTECWWSNGLGRQVTNITEDFNDVNASRSSVVINGGTDIGSDEFTPTTSPPQLTLSGSHSPIGTETLTLAGRPIAKIIWGSTGILPTLVSTKFYSGIWPNDTTNNGTVSLATFFNSYLSISDSGGSNYGYDLLLNYDEPLNGTIAFESNLVVARRQIGVAGSWKTFGGKLDTNNNTLLNYNLKSFGEFTGTENTRSLGALQLSNNHIDSNQMLCYGALSKTITGTFPIGGNGSFSYSWLSSTTSANTGFGPVTGNPNSQNYAPGNLTISTWYKRVVHSGTSDTSQAVLISVYPAIDSNFISSPQAICIWSTPSALIGSQPIGGDGGYTYQWQRSVTGPTTGFLNLSGAISKSYSPGSLTISTWFRRIVKTTQCGMDTSISIGIVVHPFISNNSINTNQTICVGQLPGTLIGSIPQGGSGNYSFQWLQSLTGNNSGFLPIAGATSDSYTPDTVKVTKWYRRLVISTCSDTSNVITISAIPSLLNNSISKDQTICYGFNPQLLNGSTPTGGGVTGNNYSYQWYSSNLSSSSGFVMVSGATLINYTPPSLTSSTWYRRVVTTSTCADTSSAIMITVNPLITSNTISASQNVCIGDFPVPITGSTPVGGGGGYNYQWLSSTSNSLNGFTAITGATFSNYSPGIVTVNTWYKRVVFSFTCADTSAAIQITINLLPTSNVKGISQVCSSDTATYKDTLQAGVTYSWNVTGGTVVSSTNNAVLIVWGNAGTGSVTSQATIGTTGCKYSSSFNVIINPTPIFPVITRNLGILSVTPQTGATYQWYKNGTIITGDTNSSTNASINYGKYKVTATIGNCKITSAEYDYVSVGLRNLPLDISNLNVYPNPNKGKLNISFNVDQLSPISISIVDVSGRELMHLNEPARLGMFDKIIDIQSLTGGIYFINIQTSQGIFCTRIIKE